MDLDPGVEFKQDAMFRLGKLVAFISTRDPGRALAFYRGTLGLRLLAEEPTALVFDAHGTMLRVSIVPEVAAASYTVLGWQVADIRATVEALTTRGVRFERFDSLDQDELGVWSAPGGDRVAWFKDPDGNLLSVSHFVKSG